MAPKAKHAMVLKESMMDGVSRARGVRRARAMLSLEAPVINNLNGFRVPGLGFRVLG